jgi:superfamily II DNA or RNA helicase
MDYYKASQNINYANDWTSLTQILSSKSKKEKGDTFELLVKLYLQTNPKYNLLFSKVWLLEEMPLKLLKRLNQPITDEGVDLYAKTKNGEYWSIQAKYKSNPKSTVTRKDLTTFTDLTYVRTDKISFGLVCQSTNQYTKKFEGYQQLGFLTNEVWAELTEEDFKAFKALIKTPEKAKRIKPYKPFPHQKKAIKSAKEHYLKKKNKRGKLILPCGAGKSLTGYWIGKEFESKSIIVCVPSLNLIKQTLDSWCRESYANKIDMDWICVCSDQSIGRLDDTVVYTQNLGVQVDTDIDKIADWLRKRNKKIKVVFTTYQSGKVIALASQKAKKLFDFGIFDEAHKTVGSKEKLFSYLLFDENIKIKKRVFMTATERRYKGSSDQILSMDNPKIYGDTFELMTFKEAIELKKPILTDYKVITVCIDDSEYQEYIENNTYVKPKKGKWNKEMEMKSLTSLIALRKAVNKYNIKHAITFHNSIAKAEAFQESNENINQDYPSFKKVDTFHVTGKTNTAIRSKTLKDFSTSKRAIITNARCLTEGIDVKNVDCVLFADPKKSTVDIVQAVGRALRLYEGKQFGYVIIPVQTYSTEGTLEVKEESYDAIVNVLRSLASNDERIIEYFRDISEGKKSKGKKIEIDINEELSEKISISNFESELSLKIWDKLGKLNWRDFVKARAFVQSLRLKSNKEWRLYCRSKTKPNDIPYSPDNVYNERGWKNWNDWLGTNNRINANDLMPFKKARSFVHKLELKSETEWRKYKNGELKHLIKLPKNISKAPRQAYRNKGWISWADWLNNDNVEKQWDKYEDARKFVHKLKLKYGSDWIKYCKGEIKDLPPRPATIPKTPSTVYSKLGWKDMSDWLGPSYVVSIKNFLPIQEAKKIIHPLRINSRTKWNEYCKGKIVNLPKKPDNIPMSARKVYLDNGWKGWGDWLGTGREKVIEWMPIEKAKKYVHKLKLKSGTEWREYVRGEKPELPNKPKDIPSRPGNAYKNKGWKGMGDWLGTGKIANRNRKYRDFESARKFSHSLNLESSKQWSNYCKGQYSNLPEIPIDIPKKPRDQYKKHGWKGMNDWLGIKETEHYWRENRNFEGAKKFVQKLKLSSTKEWNKYCKGQIPNLPLKPIDIPSNPRGVYKNKGWKGMGDFLGTGKIATHLREYKSYDKAKLFVHKLNLKSQKEWRKYCKGEFPNLAQLPDDIPASPHKTYKDKGWRGISDWLGTIGKTYKISKFRQYSEAAKFAKSLKLNSVVDWRKYCKDQLPDLPPLPNDIPRAPDKAYENKGWKGFGDWLGTNRISNKNKNYRKFSEAQKFVKSLKLGSVIEWRNYCKGQLPNLPPFPHDIPRAPNKSYKNRGWTNWYDWLGKT